MLKHAGPATATVSIRYADTRLDLKITDDGRGADAGQGDLSRARYGHLGMRERVGLFHGELRLGPRLGGGYEVSASLPLNVGSDVTIRVLVADDQPLMRAAFEMTLSPESDIECVGEAADGVEAVEQARHLRPDVVLMDIRMPRLDGVEATRILAAEDDAIKILILTTFDIDEYVVEALRAGASGFLLKDVRADELVRAIRVVADGETLLAPSVTRRLLERFVELRPPDLEQAVELDVLTPAERTVLTLIGRGRSNQRDRRRAHDRRHDRAHARAPHLRQARAPRPRPGGRARVQHRAGPAHALGVASRARGRPRGIVPGDDSRSSRRMTTKRLRRA